MEIQIDGVLSTPGAEIKTSSEEIFGQQDENFDVKINAPKS
jgi:hypothetical protein